MTLLGMLVLGVVEKTPVLSVVDIRKGVRYYTKCLNIHNSVKTVLRLCGGFCYYAHVIGGETKAQEDEITFQRPQG